MYGISEILKYAFYEDGTASKRKYFTTKYYTQFDMEKKWNKWYKSIINPMKNKRIINIKINDMNIDNFAGVRADLDCSTHLNDIDHFNNIDASCIIGLFFMNIDIDLEIHKYNFIEILHKLFNLNKDGLDYMFDCIKFWSIKKKLLKTNDLLWTHYDYNIFSLNNNKSQLIKLDESELIRIKLFGSHLYDNLVSYHSYTYILLNLKYDTIEKINKQYEEIIEKRKL